MLLTECPGCPECNSALTYTRSSAAEARFRKSAAKGGTKHDQDKNRLDLLEPTFIEEMGKVMTFGAKKYTPDNWRGGLLYRRLLGAALRHIFAFARGEAYDKETGTSHLANAACCLMMLYWMWVNRPDLDDRAY